MKIILQRDNQKRDKKIQHKHISHDSLKQNSERSQEGGRGGRRRKKMNVYI